jgi:spermidine/putrescine transport system permease protein
MFNKSLLKSLSNLWLLFTIIFVYAPVFIMIAFSFNTAAQTFTGWEGFSLKWYQQFISDAGMVDALIGSLSVGFLATLFSISLSLLVVVASQWWNPWWLLSMFMVNVSIPEIFLAVVVLIIFVFLKVKMGIVSLVVCHYLLGFGMAVPMLRSAFLDIKQALIDSSLDLGATYLQTFRYILFPILKPAIIYSSFMIFTLSMDDFYINFFCSGVEFKTVSTLVYTQVKSKVDPSLNALSSTLFFISFTLVLLLVLPKNSKSITTKAFKDDN